MLKVSGKSEKENVNIIANKIINLYNELGNDVVGDAYIGYPIYAMEYTNERLYCDLAIVSNYGVYIFSISEGEMLNYKDIQDELFLKLESKFKKCKFLVSNRKLIFDYFVLTFCQNFEQENNDECLFSKYDSLKEYIIKNDSHLDNSLIDKISSALQEANGLNKKSYYENVSEDTKAYLINKMNDIIEKYDINQMNAITVDPKGIQRIRGMAGSGKTVIIARKAVELHTEHPDWTIVVTYFTRTLKSQFIQLIDKFYKNKNDGQSPNYDKLKIMHAWGSSSSDGVYYDICKHLEAKSYSYGMAKSKYPLSARPFNDICSELLKTTNEFPNLYDCILIDEAQDFDENFLKLCFNVLDDNKRLVYAYDELQNLNELSMQSPEKIFGFSISNDTPLRTCYRNQSNVIVTAHALGMGLYRKEGMIQIPSSTNVWDSIGYKSNTEIKEGQSVTLHRDKESSPDYLGANPDDLIKIFKEDNLEDSFKQMLIDIEDVLKKDCIKPSDIMIIDLNGKDSSTNFSNISLLLNNNNNGIKIHQAASSNPEDFFRSDSIVYSSIFRAKGNEAYYVYIVNAQKSIETLSKTRDRNAIFTAITRSKGWVRIFGYGDAMDELISEYQKIKDNDYQLHFDSYPTKKEREKMVQTNKDLTKSENDAISSAKEIFERLRKEDSNSVQIALKEILGDSYKEIIESLSNDEK